MSEKEEVKKKMDALHKRYSAIEALERKKENDKLVGKYFRYRNSYSAPSKKWWVYYKIIKSSDYGYVKAFSFEIDLEMHSATVEVKEVAVGMLTTRCTEETFIGAWQETLAWIHRCAQNGGIE